MPKAWPSPSSRSSTTQSVADRWGREGPSGGGATSRCNRWSRRRQRSTGPPQPPDGLVFGRETQGHRGPEPLEAVEEVAEAAGTQLAGLLLVGQRPAPGATRLTKLTDRQIGAVAEEH